MVPGCHRQYTDRKGLAHHYRAQHQQCQVLDAYLIPNGLVRCGHCSKPYVSGTSLSSHERGCKQRPEHQATLTPPRAQRAAGGQTATPHSAVGAIDTAALAFFDSLDLDTSEAHFHQVGGATIRHVPTGAATSVKAVFDAALKLVVANLSDERAWKFLLAIPRMVLFPVDHAAHGLSPTAQIKARCAVVLRGDFQAAWDAHQWGRPSPLREERSAEEELVELGEFMEDSIKDHNFTRAVRRLTSAGTAPATVDTARLLAAKCPAEDGVDFTAESAAAFGAGPLGSATIADTKELETVVKRWLR